MATQQAVNTSGHTRCRLTAISLDPNTAQYDVTIKLIIDGKTVHKLREVKKGQILRWADLHLPFDVEQTSRVAIQIIEDRVFRKITSQVTWPATECVDKDVVLAKTDKEDYVVELRLMDQQTAEVAYIAAISRAKTMELQPGQIERSGKIRTAFGKLLKLGSMMVEQDPTGGAKAAFLACTMAWEHMEAQDVQEATLDDLVQGLARMAPTIESVKNLADKELRQTVDEMLELVEDASTFIVMYKSESMLKRVARSMTDSSAQDRIERYRTTFERLRKEFDTRATVQLLHETHVATMRKAFDALGSIDQASHGHTTGCLPGTRTGVIEEVISWAQSESNGPRLAWLYGRAGLGKSSIASSVCQVLRERNALACSFFCKRDKLELRSPRNVLAGIIRGLSRRWEAYRDAAGAVLSRDPESASQQVLPMYDSLIAKPLNGLIDASRPSARYIFVVDALDECGDDATRKQLLVCLLGVSQLDPAAVVLVTSRSNPDIRDFFDTHQTSYRAFDLEQYDARADIRAYVYYRLSTLQPPTGWPKDGAEQIWRLSAGLFIYARTACRFIEDGYEPVKRLNLILADKSWGDIDSLYTTTLRAALQDVAQDNAEYMRRFLGAVVTTASCAALRASDLAALLGSNVSEQRLKQLLHNLSSFVYDDQRLNGAVRISHPSFVEYITNEVRSNGLCVDTKLYNALIARHCFEAMRDNLRFNMCGLKSSGLLNCDVPDLTTRVRRALAPHVVYSCQYWSTHAVKSDSEETVAELEKFLSSPTLLYWLEALSLLGELKVALACLREVERSAEWMQARRCRTMANDAYRFLLAFYDPISQSTPHLYVTALAFAPENSIISRRMRAYFPRLAVITGGVKERWSACTRTIGLLTHNPTNKVFLHGICTVVYSPDGRRIASCLCRNLYIWDAETGELVLGPLHDESDSVRCVAYSPDSRRVASGLGNRTVHIWDTETGEALCQPMKGHLDAVNSVAYSPCGGWITSGSDDHTIRVWDANTGECVLGPLYGHSDRVRSVAYSPDNGHIASGSADQTVRVWDSSTGDLVQNIQHGLSYDVYSVSYSPDGHHIASGTNQHTIHIWDTETGQAVFSPLEGHEGVVESVAYSPDGRQVVSSSLDGTVRIWDAVVGKPTPTVLRGDSERLVSAAYSPDGRCVVSCSQDYTIRIWDLGTDETMLQQGHRAWVTSVAYSPDGRRIASGSCDTTVRVWDAQTGNSVLGPLKCHSDAVLCVIYSPDGRHLASGSKDKTVHIWDTDTVAVISTLTHVQAVNSVAYSPNGKYIASGSADHNVWVWNANTGEAMFGPMQGHSGPVFSVAYTPDGRFLVSNAADSRVYFWDAEAGKSSRDPLHDQSDWVYSATRPLNEHQIVSISADYTAWLWNAQSGKIICRSLQQCTRNNQSVAYSRDSCFLASITDGKTIYIWAASTGEMMALLQGHTWLSTCVTYSPDGSCVVSGDMDGTIRVWDLDTSTGPLSSVQSGLHSKPHYWYLSESCHQTLGLAGYEPRTADFDGASCLSGVFSPFFQSGTQTLVPPHCFTGNRLLVHTGQLAKHIDTDHPGWVVTHDHQLLLWLPPELRRVDGSLFSIEQHGIRRRVLIDMTDFVHGDNWSLIVAPR